MFLLNIFYTVAAQAHAVTFVFTNSFILALNNEVKIIGLVATGEIECGVALVNVEWNLGVIHLAHELGKVVAHNVVDAVNGIGREAVDRLADWLCARRGIRKESAAAEPRRTYTERQYDLLAAGVRKALDMDAIYRMMEDYA